MIKIINILLNPAVVLSLILTIVGLIITICIVWGKYKEYKLTSVPDARPESLSDALECENQRCNCVEWLQGHAVTPDIKKWVQLLEKQGWKLKRIYQPEKPPMSHLPTLTFEKPIKDHYQCECCSNWLCEETQPTQNFKPNGNTVRCIDVPPSRLVWIPNRLIDSNESGGE